jgi:transposase
MSAKERRRLVVFDRLRAGQVSLGAAAQRLGISYRQCGRSYKRYRAEGAKGLVHRSRGHPSNRAKPAEFRSEVLRLYEDKYDGFGPTLAAEKLEERDGLVLDHETLRRWLLAANKWTKRRRRRKHRSWRERKAHFGELVQLDGSHHRWFGPACPGSCLMNMVDDATGTTLAMMAHEETTEAAMRILWAWIERYGVPKALYTDRKNVFVTDREPTIEEQLADIEPMTAFGKACKQLGIEIVTANSPQAKGRVERNHGVYQDRFVKELALRGITGIDGANQLLTEGFVDELNAKFAKEARDRQDYHRRVPRGLRLHKVFSFEETRVVMNDWTIRYNRRFLQILKQNRSLPRPKERVIVRRLLDGQMELLYRDRKLEFEPIMPSRKPVVEDTRHKGAQKESSPSRSGAAPGRRRRIPSKTHPWRGNYKLMWGSQTG